MTRSHQRGISLIELLAVAAIIAMLAAFAYPQLAAYVIKARRAEAQGVLLENLARQERYFTQNNTYIAFASGEGSPDAQRFKWYSGNRPASSGYEVRGRACPGQTIDRCIELQAIPGTGLVDTSFADPECHILTLNSLGEHSASGPGTRCWP